MDRSWRRRAIRREIDQDGWAVDWPDGEDCLNVGTQRKGKSELTVGDRLVTAMMGFILAFLTMCLVWLVVLRYSGGAMEPPLPFYWVWIVGLLGGAASFLAGPERMMDSFGWVWAVLGSIFRFFGAIFRWGRY
jgi:hypothetical protein